MRFRRFFSDEPQLDSVTERRVGERLRSALAGYSARVEPAANSYLTLADRVRENGPPRRGRGSRNHGRTLAAAVSLVVVVSAGAYLLSQNTTGDVSAIGGPETSEAVVTTVMTTPSTTSASVTTTAADVVEPFMPQVEILNAAEVAPADSVAEAASTLVRLLSLPGRSQVVADSDHAWLYPPRDVSGDNPPRLARVTTAAVPGGIIATGATSDTMQITEVIADGDQLVVRGEGSAFEASVEVHLVGTDGSRLSSTYTTAGCCDELVPFEARVSLVGVGEGFVVAHGDNAGSGTLPAFAAVPIRFEGVGDPRTYTVFRIRPDDSDQGLNIRDLPGADEGEVLVTLPPGSAGIRRLPRMPALIGDSFWWLVETGDGIQGWAHSSFLTPASGSITDDELVDRGRSVAAALASAESGGLDYLGLSRRVPVAVGWIGDPALLSGADLTSASLWTESRMWRVPEATYGESEKLISLRSLLNVPDVFDDEAEIRIGAALPYGFEQDWVNGYFAGTEAVTIVGPQAEDQTWRSAVLFYESSPTGPTLVGVVASIFVP